MTFTYVDVALGSNAKILARRAPKKKDGRIPLPQVYLEGEELGSFPETVAAMAEIIAAQRAATAKAAGCGTATATTANPCRVLSGAGWLTRRYQEYAAPVLGDLTAADADDFMLLPTAKDAPSAVGAMAATTAVSGQTGTGAIDIADAGGGMVAPSTTDKKRKRGAATSLDSDESKDVTKLQRKQSHVEKTPEHKPMDPAVPFPCSVPIVSICDGGFC